MSTLAVMSTATPAIDGGKPVREVLLPYSRQTVDDSDIKKVTDVLKSDWLTTGPAVDEFEKAFAEFTGSDHAVSVNSGTAALHAAMYAIGVGEGDEVIVPAMTFAATANAALFLGGTPVFADIDPDTFLIDVKSVESLITEKTKAVAAVDYAGQPCDYDALREVCERHDLVLIADAVHSLGGGMLSSSEAAPSLDSSPSASLQAPRSRRAQPSREAPAGSLADLSCFSFHPVKPVATGEGGMVTTDNEEWATRMKQFRNHCINSDHRQRQEGGSWFYEMVDLGYNYRLTDIQCALGSSQLKKVPEWTKRRQEIAVMYDEAFASLDEVSPLKVNAGISHAYHLYVIRLNLEKLDADRGQIFRALRAENIGVNVHYVPVHLHPYYQREMKTGPGMCPVTEAAYERIISLPIFAGMSNKDAEDVIEAMRKVCHAYAK